MPGIIHLLNECDPDLLRDFAQFWGIESDESVSGLKMKLRQSMSNANLIQETIGTLPETARKALYQISANSGRLNWTDFIRKYGEVRAMGAARREREHASQHPQSISEILWYHGLIGRAFFESVPEAREYVYIPDEILAQLAAVDNVTDELPGHSALQKDQAVEFKSNTRILDDSCTLLAALRMDLPVLDSKDLAISVPFLEALMADAGLIDREKRPVTDPVKKFLEAQPGQALQQLFEVWIKSSKINDLYFVPELVIESRLDNHPSEVRKVLLDKLKKIPKNTWWNIQSLIDFFHNNQPDFQRPAGNFDSWLIKSKKTGQYLHGFDCWDDVDGALLRYLLTGPLHWLGLVDLASTSTTSRPGDFRLSQWSTSLLNSTALVLPPEDFKITMRSTGQILIPFNSSRAARYIISRFCEWDPRKRNGYFYHISTRSLSSAREQGLKIAHLIRVLEENSAAGVPPKLRSTLEKWDSLGTQVNFQHTVLLTVAKPEILEIIKKSKAGKFLEKQLNATTIEIRKGFEKQVEQELLEIGYLAEFHQDV